MSTAATAVDAYVAVSSVYALAALEGMAQAAAAADTPSAWRNRDRLADLAERAGAALMDEVTPLARAFRDYIALVCAGEARHANKKCSVYWSGYHAHGVERDTVYMEVCEYNPHDILTAALPLFGRTWLSPSYGGWSWHRIAKTGLLYGTIPDLAFLDLAVDLSHNSGPFLDKGVIFHVSNIAFYRRLLDRKTMVGLLSPDRGVYHHVHVWDHLAALIREGRELGLHQARVFTYAPPDYSHIFVEWGGARFAPKLVSSGYYAEDEEETEEEEEYTEEPEGEAEDAAEDNESVAATQTSQVKFDSPSSPDRVKVAVPV